MRDNIFIMDYSGSLSNKVTKEGQENMKLILEKFNKFNKRMIRTQKIKQILDEK
jgi:hypothetical protein